MNYQAFIADQRDGYMRALEALADHCSIAALNRAIETMQTDPWYRDGAEERCDFAARELVALRENRLDRRASRV